MRARPRRESPQLETATPDGPFHESPPQARPPAPRVRPNRQETVLLNASVGVQRVIGRVRRSSSQESTRVVRTPTRSRVHVTRPATRWHRPISICDPTRRRRTFVLPSLAALRGLRPIPIRAALRRLGHERTVAVAVAGIVLGASFLSVAPAGPVATPAAPPATDPHPARRSADRSVTTATATAAWRRTTPTRPPTRRRGRCRRRRRARARRERPTPTRGPRRRRSGRAGDRPGHRPSKAPSSTTGRLLKPVAVNTSVADGSS